MTQISGRKIFRHIQVPTAVMTTTASPAMTLIGSLGIGYCISLVMCKDGRLLCAQKSVQIQGFELVVGVAAAEGRCQCARQPSQPGADSALRARVPRGFPVFWRLNDWLDRKGCERDRVLKRKWLGTRGKFG